METAEPERRQSLPGCVNWILIPLGWAGGMVGAMVVLGIVLLWRYPDMAERNGVELRDLVARSVDPHWGDPFYVLKGRDAWDRHRLDWYYTDDGKKVLSGEVVWWTKKLGENRLEFQVAPKGKQPVFTKQGTTPYLNVPAQELSQARARIKQLFPGKEEEVRRWGQAVFYWWMRNLYDRQYNAPEMVSPDMGRNVQGADKEVDDQYYWCAWRQLCANIPSAEEELPRLKELARQAFPDAAQYRAALQWASNLHARLDETFKQWNEAARVQLATAVPPKDEFTQLWLLYQYVGLTEQSRAAVRDRWLSYFRSGKADEVVKWGKEIEARRRKDGEALPPSTENVALLCVLERIRGTDAYGEKCRQAVVKEISPEGARTIASTVALGAYPNDDFFMVFAADDPFGTYDMPANRWIMISSQIMMLIGLRLFLTRVFAERWLKLQHNPVYDRYCLRKPFYRDPVAVGVYLVVPLFAWLASFLTVPQDIALVVSPWRRLIGIYLSVWLGGTMLSCLSRGIAITMIWAGLDPEKHWIDEAVSLPVGVFILFHFQNDFFSILANVMIEVIPELNHRLGGCRLQWGSSSGRSRSRKPDGGAKKEGGANVGSVWEQRAGKKPRNS